MNGQLIQVSVIIPTFNRDQVLAPAIESVLSQSYQAHEIIVVDDGSDDGTQELLRKYPVKVVYQHNQGPSAARNHGARLAEGQYVSFLDSDDQWKVNKLERQIEAIETVPEAQLFYTGETWIRNGVRVNACKHHKKYSGWIYEQCIPLCIISPSSVLMPMQLFREVGGFDESLPAAEDYDLWLRLTSIVQAHFIEEELIIKTGGHDDQLSNMRGIDQYRVKALEKMMVVDHLKEEWRSLTHSDLCRRLGILIKGFKKYGHEGLENVYREKLSKWERVD